jgi:hypothetical protein
LLSGHQNIGIFNGRFWGSLIFTHFTPIFMDSRSPVKLTLRGGLRGLRRYKKPARSAGSTFTTRKKSAPIRGLKLATKRNMKHKEKIILPGIILPERFVYLEYFVV